MRDCSFSYKSRLKKPGEFQKVYKKGRRLTTKHFVLFFFKNKSEEGERKLGITVTKAIGKANERNKIKRRVREFFRLNKFMLPSGEIVIKARMGAWGATKAEIRKDLEKGFKRLSKKNREG